jgi:hypothetical protein
LGQRDYILRYRHNSRTDSWTLDIESVGEAGQTLPLMTGKKLHVGHDLLRNCNEAERPPGRLFVLSMDGIRVNPTGSTLGKSKMVYLDPGETLGGF